MSKYPISWHVECHKNHLATVVRKREEMERLRAEIKRSEDELEFYTTQINAAVGKGLKEFDRDRFMKKRAK